MKKILWLLPVLFLVVVVLGGIRINQLSRRNTDLQMELRVLHASLDTERQHLTNTINENDQVILGLQYRLNEIETQRDIQASVQNEIMTSFMDNLKSVAEFLGISDLYIASEDIEMQGNFVTAHGYYNHHPVRLFFRHWALQEEIRWVLLEYWVGWVSGPGLLDGGSSWRRWEQDGLFTESFTMRFYDHCDNLLQPIGIRAQEEISPQNWQQQVINHMQTHTMIQLADLWYEGSRLVVNLKPATVMPFNWGSTGGAMHTLALIDSLASLPNVTEIEVLVGGQKGIAADHFSFAGAFTVNRGIMP